MTEEREWPELRLGELLERLTAAGVDFVVIGGVARTLLGSPRVTKDLDICYARDDANLEALGRVLIDLDARLRGVDEDVPFVPDSAALDRVTILTLTTSAGWLDLVLEPDGSVGFEHLRRKAERVDVGKVRVLVASIDDMIEMKRAAGRPQDLADIEELLAIRGLRER